MTSPEILDVLRDVQPGCSLKVFLSTDAGRQSYSGVVASVIEFLDGEPMINVGYVKSGTKTASVAAGPKFSEIQFSSSESGVTYRVTSAMITRR